MPSQVAILLLAATLIAGACGGSSPAAPTPPQVSRASIAMTTAPTSIAATCVATGSLCAATVTVTIEESAGLGVSVNAITSAFRNRAGTIADTATFDAGTIVTMSGTNHIAAKGSLTVPTSGNVRIGNLWSQAGGVGRVGTLVITVQATDDHGNAMTATASVPVS